MIELNRQLRALTERVERFLAGLQLAPQSNHIATAAPGVGDDANDGYQAGSLWTDVSAGEAYVCVDPAVGAAVWKQIT